MFDWTQFIQQKTPFYNETNETPLISTEVTTLSLCLLTQYQLISIEGADALKFLQGQCSCDFQKLDKDTYTYGSHCTPKGRMISSFLAVKTAENAYYLRVHHSAMGALLTSLKKYSVFSKVSINTLSQTACFALMGSKMETQKIANALNSSTTKTNIKKIIDHSPHIQDTHSHDTHSQTHTIEVWLNVENIQSNDPLLALPILPVNYWEIKLIRNGIGEVREETIEQLIPQEINLQLVGGVDFKKGCYTGQEIIARMHYRANLKKHMYYGKITDKSEISAPAPGSALRDNTSDKKIGSIIISTRTNSLSIEFLALMNDEYIQSGMAILSTQPQAKIQWLPLPYAIT